VAASSRPCRDKDYAPIISIAGDKELAVRRAGHAGDAESPPGRDRGRRQMFTPKGLSSNTGLLVKASSHL
jgi:hypothetical protein